MTKKMRKIVGLLLGLIMVLSIMAPSMAMAATPRPETGNLNIHKLQTNYDPFNDALITNDGLTKTPPSDATPLEKAIFTVYKVSDEMMINDIVEADLTGGVSVETDADGLALFSDLAAGRYYVKETFTPKGVEAFSGPFLVDVPMMNPNGTEWNSDVHVYPKNQLILGAVELTKWAENGTTGLEDAVFSLYRELEGEDELIEPGLTTDANGNIEVGDLVVGSYYFVETTAPDGYGLNTTPITFEITKNDHAYGLGNDLGNLVESKVIDVELMNYDLPDIQKFVTTIDNKVETADFNEDILWIIRPEVPGDIATYSSFVIVDTFGPEMDFNNDVTINDGAITDFTVDFTSNVLTIDITPSALDGVTDLTIEFTTFFNNTAIMGMDYYNNVDLEFNNGYDDYDATEEVPPYAHTGGKAFKKVNKDDEGLPGAEFLIYKGDNMYLQSDYSWGAKSTAWVFTSDTNGYFEVKGLAYGQYFLEEIKAPQVGDIQYRLLDNDYEFTVNANSYYSGDVANLVAADPAEIENSPEITLPQTGGVGTLVFSIIGLGLMGSSVKLYKKSEK